MISHHHTVFISAIHAKKVIRLRFYSKEDKGQLERTCAPLDFGPSRKANEKNDRYHVWDYDSDTGSHVLSLSPEQVITVVLLDREFDPVQLVTWDTKRSPWYIERDWGSVS